MTRPGADAHIPSNEQLYEAGGGRLLPSDRLEISDLYARYAFAFDKGLAEDWAAAFTPEGSFDIDGKLLQGRAELVEFARFMFKPPGMLHFVSNLLVTPTPDDGAAGRAYVQVMRVAADGSLRMVNIGEYEDVIVRHDSAWRFRARRFRSWVPAALGDVPIAQSRQPQGS